MNSPLDTTNLVRLRKEHVDAAPDGTLRRIWMRLQAPEASLSDYLADGWHFDDEEDE